MNSLTNKLQISDEQISAAFAAIGCDIDVSGEYGEPHRFTVTDNTLDDFLSARNHYSKPGAVDKKTATELVINGVAVRPGDHECDLYIIDFGNSRIVCRF